MFDLADAAGVLQEVNACRAAYPDHYIRVNAYDASLGRQTTALSFIVHRPAEPSPGSGSTGRRPPTGTSATRFTPTPPTADRRALRLERHRRAS